MASRDPYYYDNSRICSFAVGESEELAKIITIHIDEKGNLVFSVFQPEEWEMIVGMCEITGKNIGQFIAEIQQDNKSRAFIMDPKDFNDGYGDPFGFF